VGLRLLLQRVRDRLYYRKPDVVHFDNGTFYALQEFLFDKTVIGNVHDTPEA
jgi:hypothetical protein